MFSSIDAKDPLDYFFNTKYNVNSGIWKKGKCIVVYLIRHI